jgi:hypothetical protein
MVFVPLHAGLLALLFVFLSVRVIGARRSARIPLGAAEDALLLRRMRVHANFAEYVPLALLLLAFLEWRGASAVLLNALCVLLLIGRGLHAYGVSQPKEDFRFRVAGMAATFVVIGTSALLLVLGSLAALLGAGA